MCPSSFKWLDEVGNIIEAERVGDISYAGSYCMVYFRNFKALAIKRNGKWALVNRIVPNYIRGCYAAAQYLKV